MNAITNNLGIVKPKKPTPSIAFNSYWKFATERQNVFFQSRDRALDSLTADKIIGTYKFTNAYRASDRVSQYLIKNVIYAHNFSPEDTFFRILLFKLFNKIETWQLLERTFEEIAIKNFSVDKFNKILTQAMDSQATIYSAAYIIPSGSAAKYKGVRKHQFHLELIASLIKSRFFHKVQDAVSLMEIYHSLLDIESFGKFLSYQFTIDFNYSDYINFSENDFVVPGPGAKDGIRKCFSDLGDYNETDIIRLMTEEQHKNFEKLGLNFQNLWGRDLQLIDCQNLFCEVDKYCRVAHPDIVGISNRSKIKQKYTRTPAPIDYFYPPKWDINNKIYPESNTRIVS